MSDNLTKTQTPQTPSVPKRAEGFVELKPLPKKGWSGVNLFPKCHDSLCVPMSRHGAKVEMTEEERLWLESELFLAPGELKSNSPFWFDYTVIFDGRKFELDLSKPKDYLNYKVLLACDRVANSMKERTRFPKAVYVLTNTDIDKENEISKAKVRKEAYAKFLSLSIEQMRNVVKVMGKVTDSTKADTVEAYLENVVNTRPQEFLDIVNSENFNLLAFVKDLQNANVIRKIKGMYTFGDTSLGADAKEIADFLNLKDNQEIYLLLKQRYEAARSPRK